VNSFRNVRGEHRILKISRDNVVVNITDQRQNIFRKDRRDLLRVSHITMMLTSLFSYRVDAGGMMSG
jgi:hypothetical protein